MYPTAQINSSEAQHQRFLAARAEFEGRRGPYAPLTAIPPLPRHRVLPLENGMNITPRPKTELELIDEITLSPMALENGPMAIATTTENPAFGSQLVAANGLGFMTGTHTGTGGEVSIARRTITKTDQAGNTFQFQQENLQAPTFLERSLQSGGPVLLGMQQNLANITQEAGTAFQRHEQETKLLHDNQRLATQAITSQIDNVMVPALTTALQEMRIDAAETKRENAQIRQDMQQLFHDMATQKRDATYSTNSSQVLGSTVESIPLMNATPPRPQISSSVLDDQAMVHTAGSTPAGITVEDLHSTTETAEAVVAPKGSMAAQIGGWMKQTLLSSTRKLALDSLKRNLAATNAPTFQEPTGAGLGLGLEDLEKERNLQDQVFLNKPGGPVLLQRPVETVLTADPRVASERLPPRFLSELRPETLTTNCASSSSSHKRPLEKQEPAGSGEVYFPGWGLGRTTDPVFSSEQCYGANYQDVSSLQTALGESKDVRQLSGQAHGLPIAGSMRAELDAAPSAPRDFATLTASLKKTNLLDYAGDGRDRSNIIPPTVTGGAQSSAIITERNNASNGHATAFLNAGRPTFGVPDEYHSPADARLVGIGNLGSRPSPARGGGAWSPNNGYVNGKSDAAAEQFLGMIHSLTEKIEKLAEAAAPTAQTTAGTKFVPDKCFVPDGMPLGPYLAGKASLNLQLLEAPDLPDLEVRNRGTLQDLDDPQNRQLFALRHGLHEIGAGIAIEKQSQVITKGLSTANQTNSWPHGGTVVKTLLLQAEDGGQRVAARLEFEKLKPLEFSQRTVYLFLRKLQGELCNILGISPSQVEWDIYLGSLTIDMVIDATRGVTQISVKTGGGASQQRYNVNRPEATVGATTEGLTDNERFELYERERRTRLLFYSNPLIVGNWPEHAKRGDLEGHISLASTSREAFNAYYESITPLMDALIQQDTPGSFDQFLQDFESCYQSRIGYFVIDVKVAVLADLESLQYDQKLAEPLTISLYLSKAKRLCMRAEEKGCRSLAGGLTGCDESDSLFKQEVRKFVGQSRLSRAVGISDLHACTNLGSFYSLIEKLATKPDIWRLKYPGSQPRGNPRQPALGGVDGGKQPKGKNPPAAPKGPKGKGPAQAAPGKGPLPEELKCNSTTHTSDSHGNTDGYNAQCAKYKREVGEFAPFKQCAECTLLHKYSDKPEFPIDCPDRVCRLAGWINMDGTKCGRKKYYECCPVVAAVKGGKGNGGKQQKGKGAKGKQGK